MARFTLEELDFLRTEIYSSLCADAEDPIFERVYQKLKTMIAARNGPTHKREFPPQSDGSGDAIG
jgi:hypothetical protein